MPSSLRIVRLAFAPLTRTRLFRWVAPRALPSFVLHSIGAKLLTERDTELMYTPDGRGRAIVVAGTGYARHRHAAWTYNLIAHPDAAISVRGNRMSVRATRIDESGREDAWRRIEQPWPGYRAYERESGRTVRLFLRQPVREAADKDWA